AVGLTGWVRRRPPGRRRWLAADGAAAGLIISVEVAVWALSGGGFFWPVFSGLGWSLLFGLHALSLRQWPPGRRRELARRVETLARTRRGALDDQATELARVERDLHDGAQARLVSLALSLGLAENLLDRDPAAAAKLLGEARSSAVGALDDLRTVMHSIHPPVLADRGLGAAVRALALDLAVPVTVTGEPQDQLAPAAQSAVYFAVAECLANIVKHSRADGVWVEFPPGAEGVAVVVRDDGAGGAGLIPGRGLAGVRGRLDAFDGQLGVESPPGGPTTVTISLPAAERDR
ncbi:sensor histidine kinase, partial [Frankia sp. AgKG'84/4]|uniref:sensor histidine kinase n=1 Tax=Frankia sp. AgKG'84/4 TaxID=573490 RepID=UPI002029CAE9